jgi:NSS family neurotransmitter:Na+ symporter
MSSNKENWGSRVGLILAMAGNAVGLGNFLRFPVQAIQNGGGAFIVPYLVCFLLMGIPLLWIEWSMGRFGGKKGDHSTPFILNTMDKRSFWKYIGVFGIFTNIAVAAYYCYIESWTLSYMYHSLVGTFGGKSPDEVAGFFGSYISLTTIEPIVFWIVCLVLNTWILSKGLSGGVEKVAKIGMPLLILFGILLAIKGITLKAGVDGAIYDGTLGLNFLWTPDFSTIWSPKVWLAAAGQIFFTLSVGMGSIQCYASYVKPKDDIALNAMSAGWMNEFVEVVLGSAIIIPISIGYLGIDKVVELTQSGGLGLGFKTLPYLFQQWGTGVGGFSRSNVVWFIIFCGHYFIFGDGNSLYGLFAR